MIGCRLDKVTRFEREILRNYISLLFSWLMFRGIILLMLTINNSDDDNYNKYIIYNFKKRTINFVFERACRNLNDFNKNREVFGGWKEKKYIILLWRQGLNRFREQSGLVVTIHIRYEILTNMMKLH